MKKIVYYAISIVLVVGVLYLCGYRIQYDQRIRPFKFRIIKVEDPDKKNSSLMNLNIHDGTVEVNIDSSETDNLLIILNRDNNQLTK